MKNQLFSRILGIAILAFWANILPKQIGYAGEASVTFQKQYVTCSSGSKDGNGTAYYLGYSQQLTVGSADWIILHFSDASLGTSSYVKLIGQNGAAQILDATSIAESQYYSAFFNGNSVTVNLYVAPTDAGVHIQVDTVLVGQGPASHDTLICGTDNRDTTSISGVGRFFGPRPTKQLTELRDSVHYLGATFRHSKTHDSRLESLQDEVGIQCASVK